MKPRHQAKVRKLHEQSNAYSSAGDFAAALRVSEQALQFAFRHGGRDDPDLGGCFCHLGRLQEEAGDLIAAESSYNAASSILDPTEGEPTPLKAELLWSYGTLLLTLHLSWRAILLLEHAKRRYTELLGASDENVGRCASMMATAYETVQLEDEALAAYDEALGILRAAWGADHPSIRVVEFSRADLVFWHAFKAGDGDDVDRALSDFRQGLARLEAERGPDDPEAAAQRATLGTYLVVSEQYEEGVRLLADAIAVLEAAGQPATPFRWQLATALSRLGDAAGAFGMVRLAMREAPLGQRLAIGSERERKDELGHANSHLAQYLDLFMVAGADDPAVVGEACDLVLSRRAVGAELLAAQREAVSRTDDPELAPLMERRAELRQRAARSSLVGEDAGETLGEIDRVEWELASRTPAIDLADRLPEFTHQTAAALLPDPSVLVEFVRFTRRVTVSADPDAVDDGASDWYIAFVIRSGDATVQLIDLGSAPALDARIDAYRGVLTRPDSPRDTSPGRDIFPISEDVASEAGDGLIEALVQPLLAAIGGRTRVFLAPDGDLTRLPFEALRDPAGNYLIDTLEMSYLSAGRDLKTLASRPAHKTAGAALVLANPDYDLVRQIARRSPGGRAAFFARPAIRQSDVAGPDGTAPAAPEPLRPQLNDSGIRFADLPGTREEGIAVAALLNVEPFLGGAAREEVLKSAHSPLVLHIATHGFFLPAPRPQSAESHGTRSAGMDAAARNPLLRSGIALAGANAWLRGERLPADMEDGILNGEDIVGMDLAATELVVLSACETGLGHVVAGEGVMGLRRAFAVAGARTLVLSLWKVPDLQTQLLMTAFYESLIAGNGRAAALRDAQRHVRTRYPSPLYWAAFICQGDPEPIAGHPLLPHDPRMP
jgi:CHAT domain-containing protein/tetratricopeptide (TPR) repeat protein